MNRRKEQNVLTQQNRGFSLMPVAHDGTPIICIEGMPTEIASSVFVTVDGSSGIALVETGVPGAGETRLNVTIDGQHVLDVSQLGRGAVLSINGRDYVFLKYMDVYLRPRALAHADASARLPEAIPARTPRPVVVDLNPATAAVIGVDHKRRIRRLAIMIGPVAALLLGAALLMLIPAKQDVPPREPAAVAAAKSSKTGEKRPKNEPSLAEASAPQSLRDLMAEADETPVKPAPAAVAPAQALEVPEQKPAATQVKQEPAKQVKKKQPAPVAQAARPAPQPALSPAALKALEGEYEEAVLIRGYDRERSVQMLQQLRKKVPAGTALRQKVETALKN